MKDYVPVAPDRVGRPGVRPASTTRT